MEERVPRKPSKPSIRVYHNDHLDGAPWCTAQRDEEWGASGWGYHVLVHGKSVFSDSDPQLAERVKRAFEDALELGFVKARVR
jgi:hypothetical protein